MIGSTQDCSCNYRNGCGCAVPPILFQANVASSPVNLLAPNGEDVVIATDTVPVEIFGGAYAQSLVDSGLGAIV